MTPSLEELETPRPSESVRIYLLVIVILGWFALILQLYLTVQVSTAKGQSALAGLITYISFFTISTNLLIAVGTTCYLLIPDSGMGRYFARPTVRSALAAYIIVVGAVYSLLLRQVWNPEGLQKVVDRLLHDVVPLLYAVYWLIVVSKSRLPWRSLLLWPVYPLAYLAYTLVRGPMANWYPYAFIDVNSIGYGRACINSVALLAVFTLLAGVMVAFSRWRARV